MVNYYKILKISPKATTAEIKSAYRRLARKKHPDVNKNSEQSAREFDTIAKADISVDFINIQPKLIRFTVSDEQKDRAITLLRHKGYEPEAISGCAKVSAVGAGMTGVPGVAAKIATALANEGIEILQSADSHTTIWVLIKGDDMEKAVLRIHEAFDLANATFPDGRQAKERGESH